ncbi:MAG: ABC transporter ATP-binding protein [Candidatus Hodarchaeales archaeon]
MSNAIEINNLSKSFGKTIALDSISLHIPKRTIFGYLGPNGAGKTTTMKIITGLLHYQNGSVQIFGEEVKSSPSTSKKNFGFLPDVLMPRHYSVRRFLTVSGRFCDLSDLNLSIRSVVKQLGLNKLQDRKIGTLSKGQRQRVGLANALLSDPPLLILDEPNSGLDPLGRMKILDLLQKLVEDDGKTVLLSSHIIGEVDKIATDLAIIHQGRILEQGKRETIQQGILDQSMYIVGGDLDLKKVSSLDYVISCEKDRLGRYLLQIKHNDVSPNQLLLDLIQKTNGKIQYFSGVELTLEDHFLKKINDYSSEEGSV